MRLEKGQGDEAWLVLSMGRVQASRTVGAALELAEARKQILPSSLGGTQPCAPPDFNPVRPMWGF